MTKARQVGGEITMVDCERGREREERKGLREKRGRRLRERNVRGERKKGD